MIYRISSKETEFFSTYFLYRETAKFSRHVKRKPDCRSRPASSVSHVIKLPFLISRAVFFNQFFIPVKGIFSITRESSFSFIIYIHIDETISF